MKGSGSARSESRAPGGTPPFRYADGEATLILHVQPGAARTAWAGLHGGTALRLRLAAPPVDGKANRACCRFVAEALDVPPSAVRIVRGAASRTKTVTATGVTPERWAAFRSAWEPT